MSWIPKCVCDESDKELILYICEKCVNVKDASKRDVSENKVSHCGLYFKVDTQV